MRTTRSLSGLSLERRADAARQGSRRAARVLRRQLEPEFRQLALALCADPAAAPAVVRAALADALHDSERPYSWACVAAVQRHAAVVRSGAGPAPVRGRLDRLRSAVGVLCDVQGHSHASAAALLGQPVEAVADLHAQSRTALGVDARRSDCRGWHLVSRRDDLTPPEQAAAQAHLETCRRCRDALAAQVAARARLKTVVPVGGTAVAGAITAVLATLGGGSVTAGAVAVGAAAVLGTAGATVVPTLPAPVPTQAPVAQQEVRSPSGSSATRRAERPPEPVVVVPVEGPPPAETVPAPPDAEPPAPTVRDDEPERDPTSLPPLPTSLPTDVPLPTATPPAPDTGPATETASEPTESPTESPADDPDAPPLAEATPEPVPTVAPDAGPVRARMPNPKRPTDDPTASPSPEPTASPSATSEPTATASAAPEPTP